MIWQDVVFGVGGFVFAASLVPTIRARQKPAPSTCLLTAGVLTAYLLALGTLGLWLGTASTSMTALAWYVLAWQSRRGLVVQPTDDERAVGDYYGLDGRDV